MKVEKVFDLVGKILLWTVILFVILLVIYFFGEVVSTGIVVSLAILVITMVLLWFYWKDISPAASLRPEEAYNQEGEIRALARVIERASKGYDVSRDQMDTLATYITGKDTHITGKGERYLDNLEEVLQ
ncbi:MAG: hypothetical protein HXS40_00790 [Theionarchaea archaeon]|nr:hypothetical protein [Theionarchaea archaeon]